MRNKPELHSKLARVRNLYLIDVLELAKQRFFQPPIDEVTRGSRETLFIRSETRLKPSPLGDQFICDTNPLHDIRRHG